MEPGLEAEAFLPALILKKFIFTTTHVPSTTAGQKIERNFDFDEYL
jgi:hypothetical protein